MVDYMINHAEQGTVDLDGLVSQWVDFGILSKPPVEEPRGFNSLSESPFFIECSLSTNRVFMKHAPISGVSPDGLPPSPGVRRWVNWAG